MAQPLPETQKGFITVKTTLPTYPPIEARLPIRTKNLLIRPYEASDMDAFRQLRLQPETMKWTKQGKPDGDLAATQAIFAKKLPPHANNSYEMAICDPEGRLIGTGGCHLRKGEYGWPMIGYMLGSDTWGKGYATEFVKAFLEAYWTLPRTDVELDVDEQTVEVDGTGVVRERIGAVTLGDNFGSQKVLTKTGFVKVIEWEKVDLRYPEQKTNLFAWVKEWPGSVS